MAWPFAKPTHPIATTAAPDPADDHRPKIGDVNVLEVALGLRGVGKSTGLATRCLELQRSWGAYVIGHSLGARLPARLPDGTELPIRYYGTLAKLEQGLSAHPGDWHVLASGRADDVIAFARRLSAAIRKRAWEATGTVQKWGPECRMDGIRAVPIIFLVDEGIAVKAARGKSHASHDDEWFQEWIFSLRHEHMAVLWGIQNSTARTWLLVEQASRIYAYRTRHQWALSAVQAAGATPEQVDRIRSLEVGRFELIE